MRNRLFRFSLNLFFLIRFVDDADDGGRGGGALAVVVVVGTIVYHLL